MSGANNKHSYRTLCKVKGQTPFSKNQDNFLLPRNFYVSIIPTHHNLCFLSQHTMKWCKHAHTKMEMGKKGVSELGVLKKSSKEEGALRRKWATKYEIAEGGATSATTFLSWSEEADITASAYKHLGNEAPVVLGSGHADLSISSMYYSPCTAILPPAAPGKDWFRFLFICFSFPSSPFLCSIPRLPFCSFSIKLKQARH